MSPKATERPLLHPLSQLQQEHYTKASSDGSKGSATIRNPSQPGPATVSHPTTDIDSDDEVRVGLGDLVAIVLSSSTPVQPLVELGQVLRMNSDCTKFCYAPFRNAGGNTYCCHVGCMGRVAREDIVVFPIGAEYDALRSKAQSYMLSPHIPSHQLHNRDTNMHRMPTQTDTPNQVHIERRVAGKESHFPIPLAATSSLLASSKLAVATHPASPTPL